MECLLRDVGTARSLDDRRSLRAGSSTRAGMRHRTWQISVSRSAAACHSLARSGCDSANHLCTLRVSGAPAHRATSVRSYAVRPNEERKAEFVKLHRAQAFAGFLIVSLIALIGFAAFSATSLRAAPPLDIPDDASARIAGQILGVDLGPEVAQASVTPRDADDSAVDDAAGDADPDSSSSPAGTSHSDPP